MNFSRRTLLRSTGLAGTALAGTALAGTALAGTAIAAAPLPPKALTGQSTGAVRWLDDSIPSIDEGQCWGQPWPRGTKFSKSGYHLRTEEGARVAVDSWPLAWWPDGSLKWSGHASPARGFAAVSGALVAGAAPAPAPDAALSIRETPESIDVVNGDTIWRLARRGPVIIASVSVAGQETLRNLRLIATAQTSPEAESGIVNIDQFDGIVSKAVVEARGPLRAVVRVEGLHRGGGAEWLPFSLRLYFHAGSRALRILHTVVFDGDPAKRFIRGLGLTGEVPMNGALHDRHIRFGGEGGGLWGEAIRPLTGLRRDAGSAFREAQIAGRAVPPLAEMPSVIAAQLQYIPAWGDFTLSQPNADGFSITKRTAPGHGWIDVDTGGRAPGFGYVGGASGGAAFGLSDFWQRAPVRLDIRDAATDIARFTLWYHSPDAPPMDLRPYHGGMGMDDYYRQNQGLDITYEDYEPGWGTSEGIARSTEFRIWALPATPPSDTLVDMAAFTAKASRLLAAPQAVHSAGMFGAWNFPDTSTPALERLEARAKREVDFYLAQVEQRRWYGFWNYGDVMHSYDNDRHVWRYDIGGFAWDNSELSTDLWLWTSYLRSGRADVFRMAEAMTRHTGEVDVYHAGRLQGFGTRHGVQHWSDSSKQPRISNAAYRRIYYYLTADERCGDLMRELLGSEHLLAGVNIERKTGSVTPASKALPIAPAGQVRMSFGTVWGSLIAAWLTEWERTGDKRWRDRITAGMESIAALPKQWFAGAANYDLASGRFIGPGDSVDISHLNGAFGVFEMHAELLELIHIPAYREAWLDYCQYYNAPPQEFAAKTGAPATPRGLRQGHAKFTAYAAVQRNDPALARRAWIEFASQGDRPDRAAAAIQRRVAGSAVLKPVDEIIGISTNDAAQWGLAAIALSALIPESG